VADTAASPATAQTVQFFFDPTCPWTWLTSRWLVEVSAQAGFSIDWRSLSLALLNADREVPEQYRAPMEAGKGALRLVEAARQAGRSEEVGRFYTDLGARLHHDDAEATVALVTEVAGAAGLGDLAGAVTDTSWDDLLASSLKEARDLAGPDVGSPVLVPPGATFGFFGPIVSPPPTGAEASALWEIVTASVKLPAFYELKRGRTTGPQLGTRPT
jgi:hypothetical protein